jgi:four helix bundle protein
MPDIRSFRELKVWKKAMDLAMEIFETTKGFPMEERYSLTDQIRRSSRSVPTNIAEAWRKRRYPAAFVSKLNDAEGESAETQTHLEMAKRCGYIDSTSASRLDNSYEEIMAMLVSMVARPQQWAIRPSNNQKFSK